MTDPDLESYSVCRTTPESIGPLRLKVSEDRVRVSKIQVGKFMNPMTSSIITGLVVVVITSSMLGARAPDSEAEQAITTFYNRYLTKCGDSWYAEITFAVAEKGTPRFMNIRSLAITLMPDKLHKVDALYGIEWRGRAILSSPFRQYDQQQHSWSAWKQGTVPIEPYLHDILNYELLVSAMKSLGQWNMRFPTHAPQMGITINFRPIDCAMLPN